MSWSMEKEAATRDLVRSGHATYAECLDAFSDVSDTSVPRVRADLIGRWSDPAGDNPATTRGESRP